MGSSEEKLDEMNRLFFEMMPIFHKLKLSYKGVPIPSRRCNKSQNVAIMLIGRAGLATPSVLSKFLALEKGSVTTLIDSLVQMGLISRESDPADRRKTLLKLTAEGERQMAAISDHRTQMLKTTLELLSDEEIEELLASFHTIRKIVGKVAERQAEG